MQLLASLFVGFVMFINSAFPRADLPRVLGIEDGLSSTSDRVQKQDMEDEDEIEDENENEDEDIETPEPTTKGLINDFINRKKIEERRREELKKREEFRLKLEGLKDERKKKALETLDQNFIKINEKRVEQLKKVLEKFSLILEKIEARNPDAGLLADAKTKLAAVSSLVEAQSAKVYTVNIGEEKNLGLSAKNTVQSMRSDLKAIEDQIKELREAVKLLIDSLKPVQNETE